MDNKVRIFLLAVQDVDAAYMSKVDLESKVNVLFGEISFLKYLFEMVSSILMRNPSLSSYVTKGMGCWRGRHETQHDPLGTPLPSHLNSGTGVSLPTPSAQIPGCRCWRWEAGSVLREKMEQLLILSGNEVNI